MALHTAEWNFSEKNNNVFQLSISHFALKQIQLSVTEISVNDPILGPKMVHFTLKWTFLEKSILSMFSYSESLTLWRIVNKSNRQFSR